MAPGNEAASRLTRWVALAVVVGVVTAGALVWGRRASPKGVALILDGDRQELAVVHLGDGRERGRIPVTADHIDSLQAWLRPGSDGRDVLLSVDGRAVVVRSGQEGAPVDGTAAGWTEKGDAFGVQAEDGSLRLLDPDGREILAARPEPPALLRSVGRRRFLVLRPDQARLALLPGDETVADGVKAVVGGRGLRAVVLTADGTSVVDDEGRRTAVMGAAPTPVAADLSPDGGAVVVVVHGPSGAEVRRVSLRAPSGDDALPLAGRRLCTPAPRFAAGGREVVVSTSAGLEAWPLDGGAPRTLVRGSCPNLLDVSP